jgi:DsbC/DsbD-like thiol-disulfide interchange protein
LIYGYDGEVPLSVAIALPANFNAATVDIALRADWLLCDQICIDDGKRCEKRLSSFSLSG